MKWCSIRGERLAGDYNPELGQMCEFRSAQFAVRCYWTKGGAAFARDWLVCPYSFGSWPSEIVPNASVAAPRRSSSPPALGPLNPIYDLLPDLSESIPSQQPVSLRLRFALQPRGSEILLCHLTTIPAVDAAITYTFSGYDNLCHLLISRSVTMRKRSARASHIASQLASKKEK